MSIKIAGTHRLRSSKLRGSFTSGLCSGSIGGRRVNSRRARPRMTTRKRATTFPAASRMILYLMTQAMQAWVRLVACSETSSSSASSASSAESEFREVGGCCLLMDGLDASALVLSPSWTALLMVSAPEGYDVI